MISKEQELIAFLKPKLSEIEKNISPALEEKLRMSRLKAMNAFKEKQHECQVQHNQLILKTKITWVILILSLFSVITFCSVQALTKESADEEIDHLLLADDLSPNELLLANKFLH